MRTKYKPWAKPLLEEHPEYLLKLEDVKGKKHIYLEIGSGKGQFILSIAKENKDKFFIAVERNVTCSGFILKKLLEDQPENILLYDDDAFFLLNELDEGSVDTLYLNFSDPWPKKRHEKRRLTHSSFLDLYVRVLSKDGEIRFKSDNHDLYLFTKEILDERNDLEIVVDNPDYELAEDDYPTEYEIKKRNEGLAIHRLVLRKK